MLCACVGVPPQQLSSFNKAALPNTFFFNKPEFIRHRNDTEGKKKDLNQRKRKSVAVRQFYCLFMFHMIHDQQHVMSLRECNIFSTNIYSSEHVIYFLCDQYTYDLQGIYITSGLDFVCKRDYLRPCLCSAATYSCSHRVIVSKTEGNTKLHSSRS